MLKNKVMKIIILLTHDKQDTSPRVISVPLFIHRR